MSQTEPRNPFYLLLLLTSFLFVVTALAYGLVPSLEEKAAQMGNPPPPSDIRDSLRRDGWLWLLIEVVAMVIFGLASMILDRLRTLQKDRAVGTISTTENEPPTGIDP